MVPVHFPPAWRSNPGAHALLFDALEIGLDKDYPKAQHAPPGYNYCIDNYLGRRGAVEAFNAGDWSMIYREDIEEALEKAKRENISYDVTSGLISHYLERSPYRDFLDTSRITADRQKKETRDS